MNVERVDEFPVPPDVLLHALMSQDFYRFRYEKSGAQDYRFEHFEQTSRGFLIRILRDLEIKPGSSVPTFARGFLGHSYTLAMEFCWTRYDAMPYQADYRFSMGSLPVDIHGTMLIEGEGNRALQKVTMNVHSSLPFVGGRLVRLAADKVDDMLDSNYRSTLKYLQRQGVLS